MNVYHAQVVVELEISVKSNYPLGDSTIPPNFLISPSCVYFKFLQSINGSYKHLLVVGTTSSKFIPL